MVVVIVVVVVVVTVAVVVVVVIVVVVVVVVKINIIIPIVLILSIPQAEQELAIAANMYTAIFTNFSFISQLIIRIKNKIYTQAQIIQIAYTRCKSFLTRAW